MSGDVAVLLRGGPRHRWAYTAKSWTEICDSVRRQRARDQHVVADVLHYRETKDVDTLPNGETAVVWTWTS